MQDYDILIPGISTWDFGELQEDWESAGKDIADLHLRDASSPCLAWAISWAMGSGIRMPLGRCTISWSPRGLVGLLAQRGVRV